MPSIKTNDLIPIEPRRVNVLIHINDKKPTRHELIKEVNEKQWTLTLSDRRSTTYEHDPKRGYVIVEEIENSDKVRIEYDPKLVALPLELHADQPITMQSNMIVYGKNSGKVSHRGSCKITVTLLGRELVKPPQSDDAIDTVAIKSVREIDLGIAKAVVTTVSYYQPGVGLVKQSIDRRTKALGLFETKVRELIELAPPTP